MPLMDVVCCGYVTADRKKVECGEVTGHKEISQEKYDYFKKLGITPVSHGLCPKCYRAQFREEAKREAGRGDETRIDT